LAPIPKTSVIGSYPIFPNPEELELYRQYKDVDEDLRDPFLLTVQAAIEDFVSAGIEIPATGQTREHFVRLFLDPQYVEGISVEGGEILVTDRVRRKRPIRIEDVRFARSLLPSYYQLKEPVTGPYTLARSCKLSTGEYSDIRELAFDLARQICIPEAKELETIVDFIQFDEPFLSIDPWRDYIVDLYHEIAKALDKPIVLHVCGDSLTVFRYLIKLPVFALSLDFTYNPRLIEEVAKRNFDQMIGFGCVNTGTPIVESVSSIERLIIMGLDKIREDRITFIHPGCGERGLPLNVAYQKNVNMVIARNRVFYGEPMPARAQPMRKEDYDPRGYFLIQVDHENKQILLFFCSYEHKILQSLSSPSAEKLLYTAIELGIIGEGKAALRHLAYLGYELGKAESALLNGLPYRQGQLLRIQR
jgi:methionine synthase II (cobalamin-independent)